MLQGRKREQLEITEVITDTKSHKGSMAPLDSPMAVTNTVDFWGTRTGHGLPEGHLTGIETVCMIHDVCHTGLERALSFMDRVHPFRHPRFKVSSASAMAENKSYLQLQPPENL